MIPVFPREKEDGENSLWSYLSIIGIRLNLDFENFRCKSDAWNYVTRNRDSGSIMKTSFENPFILCLRAVAVIW